MCRGILLEIHRCHGPSSYKGCIFRCANRNTSIWWTATSLHWQSSYSNRGHWGAGSYPRYHRGRQRTGWQSVTVSRQYLTPLDQITLQSDPSLWWPLYFCLFASPWLLLHRLCKPTIQSTKYMLFLSIALKDCILLCAAIIGRKIPTLLLSDIQITGV